MQTFEQLEYGNFYHLYNHGVGKRNLFEKPENYEYFLALYDKYISPIAETYAWVLMPNHFHLLVRIKEDSASLQFSKLFNSYAQAYNKYHQTHGALFERPFKRKLIHSNEYLRQVILYIHNNPVHHGFCSHPIEYPWSSYLTCISVKPTRLKREMVMGWFDSEANFKYQHNAKIEIEELERWLGI